MNKVEQVARALAERNIRVARRWDTDPAKLEEMMPAAIEHNWRELIPDAIAAIKAMREPTEAMVSEGGEAEYSSGYVNECVGPYVAERVYTSMIDTALSEAGETNDNATTD